MKTLRLLIDPAWPHEHTDCAWYLCDSAGCVEQHGRSEPRHWPGVRSAASTERGETMACDLVLCGGQAACFQLALPKGGAGRRPEVIAAALEEFLLDDPGNAQFLVLEPVDAAGRSTIAVVAASRLAALCKILTDLGLAPRSVWPDGLLLNESAGQRQGRVAAGQIVLPTHGGAFVTFDLPALAASLAKISEFGVALPLTLCAAGESAVSLATVTQLGASSELFVLKKESEAIFPFRPPPPGGFLTGKFAPPRRRFAASRHFLPALKLLAGFVAAATLLLVAEWGWFSVQARHDQAEIEQLYRQAIPQGPMVDPLLQMQRQLDTRRRNAGKLGGGDFLQLLAGVAAANEANEANEAYASSEKNQGGAASLSRGDFPRVDPSRIVFSRIEYDNGRLQLGVSLPARALEPWLARLRQQGLRSEILRREVRDGEAIVSLAVTYGGIR